MSETSARDEFIDECECGHTRDEHHSFGRACAVEGCPCVQFDWNPTKYPLPQHSIGKPI